MLFDVRLRPAYSLARVNRALVTNGRIGCVGLSLIHNEYPYRRYEQHNQGFMTGLKSYSVQTMFVTAINVLSNIWPGCKQEGQINFEVTNRLAAGLQISNTRGPALTS